jgi:hypothetical protein
VADAVVMPDRAFAVGAVMAIGGGAGDASGQQGNRDGGGKDLLHGAFLQRDQSTSGRRYNGNGHGSVSPIVI